MTRVRLLERLNRDPAAVRGRRVREDREVRDSVAAHIEHLMNTRRGNVPIDPEFGLPSLGQRGVGADGADALGQAVREVLERYEPRVRDVEVVNRGFSREELGVRLEIHARVDYHGKALPVQVRGTMLADGRFLPEGGRRR
jgi:type VI secretion system protein